MLSKNNKIEKDFTSYWEKRILEYGDNIRAVGHKSFNNKENEIIYRAKFNILDKIFKEINIKNKKVLDAGCGIGIFSNYYINKGTKIYSIDSSPLAIRFVKKKYKKISARIASLNKIPYKNNYFDLIHCFDVLYHITDDYVWEKALYELNRTLRNGGYLIITEFWVKKTKSPKPHIKMRSKSEYLSILNKLNLKIVSEYELYFFLQKNYLLTKLFPNFCFKLESLFKYKFFKKFYGAKLILIKREQ